MLLNIYFILFISFNLLSEKIAVSVYAYNRIDYFKQTLEAIESNKESNYWDFYFFLDGGNGSKQKEISDLIMNSTVKNKIIIKRDDNYFIHKNIIEARRHFFQSISKLIYNPF